MAEKKETRSLEEAQEAGYLGSPTDPTPDENYTVAGVTADAPTPETDERAAAEARLATGVGTTRFERGERAPGEEETAAAAGRADTGTATSPARTDEGADEGEKLTGDALDARAAELGIDTSTGGSLADGSMSADEKRAAIAEREGR